jgi:hypothetical protein
MTRHLPGGPVSPSVPILLQKSFSTDDQKFSGL